MEGAVERSLGRVLARRLAEPSLDLLQRERVVPRGPMRPSLLEEGQGRGGCLVVAVERRRLPAADEPLVPQLDLDDLLLVARLARDHEGLGELQRRNRRPELHRGTLAPVCRLA